MMSKQKTLPREFPLERTIGNEWRDIQGILYRGGYAMHKSSMLALLRVVDKRLAGAWLEKITRDNNFACGLDVARKNIINFTPFTIAFSATGLRALGLNDDEMLQFSREFIDGMAPDPLGDETVSRRSGMLGDIGKNSPGKWLWGANQNTKNPGQVDILVNIYGQSQAAVTKVYDSLVKSAHGVEHCFGGKDNSRHQSKFLTYLREDKCEQFGYRDGISQPLIKGEKKADALDETTRKLHCVSPGEIVIGYETERKQPVLVPHVKHPDPGADNALFPIGKNGTYLVVRQLAQHVQEYHDMLDMVARQYKDYEKPGKKTEPDPAIDWVAARIMGRQFSGHPVNKEHENFSVPPVPKGFTKIDSNSATALTGPFPKVEKGFDSLKNKEVDKQYPNDFKFKQHDAQGLTCPLTAHVRRAFPRDSFGLDPVIALKIANRHRILRRGRLYGKNPLKQARNNPGKSSSAQAKATGGECGLFFMAFNTDIAGQYETVQHSWVNNPHFGGQYDEVDPVAGLGDKTTHKHTIQQCPINMHLKNIGDYTTVRGGGYFFMPGIEAVGILAKIAIKRN